MDVVMHWSSKPGNFVNKLTGEQVNVPFDTKMSQEEWNETLVATVDDCVNELQKITFSKWGRAKRLQIDVYAPKKICDVLKTSVLFKPNASRITKKEHEVSVQIGQITDMTIHKHDIHRDEVRVVALFDVQEGAGAQMFGNVKVLDV